MKIYCTYLPPNGVTLNITSLGVEENLRLPHYWNWKAADQTKIFSQQTVSTNRLSLIRVIIFFKENVVLCHQVSETLS